VVVVVAGTVVVVVPTVVVVAGTVVVVTGTVVVVVAGTVVVVVPTVVVVAGTVVVVVHTVVVVVVDQLLEVEVVGYPHVDQQPPPGAAPDAPDCTKIETMNSKHPISPTEAETRPRIRSGASLGAIREI